MSKTFNVSSELFIAGKNIIPTIEAKRLDCDIFSGKKNNGWRGSYRRRRKQTSNQLDIVLDSTFAKIDHVPGLKTTLFPHQQTIVSAMLELEHTRNLNCKLDSDRIVRVTYNAAVLSEPVGSGKTFDILAVICLNKIPRAIPDIMELPALVYSEQSVGYIRCMFKKFIKATIIFVGTSVMRQWENAIKTYTSLKVFHVHSVIELRQLILMIANKTVNNYDIILVKNGKITVPMNMSEVIDINEANKNYSHIYNVIAAMKEYCWARVVIDDFDTIRLPTNANIVRGVFTWYISSTRKAMDKFARQTNRYDRASDALLNHTYSCSNIMENRILFDVLNLRNDSQYLEETTRIPYPKFHVAVFENENNQYISLLTSMNNDEINRVTEMLNGDAIATAAETVGIKTTSVADIFQKILGDKFDKYVFASAVLEFIGEEQSTADQRAPMSANPDPEDKYYKKDLLEFRHIEYKYPNVNTMLTETDKEYTEIKEENGKSIQRVKDNIKHGTCPVCQVDLASDENSDVIIVKCCNAVYCADCGIKAQNLNDRYHKLQGGRCGNCRQVLTIKDLIYIGNDLQLKDIIDEKIEESEELEPVELDKIKKQARKKRTKYVAIIDIIRGQEVPEDRRVDMHIPNMMKGALCLPESPIRKVLIFANFDETLTAVIKELEAEQIKYWRLQGGFSEINTTALEFTECKETCALVVNSTRHCSGLNLQTATDLIFTHRITDQAIESQVAGRGHRLGRTSPLNIWYLSYENEYQELCATHGIREMSTSELLEEKKHESDSKPLIHESDTDDQPDQRDVPIKKMHINRIEQDVDADDESDAEEATSEEDTESD